MVVPVIFSLAFFVVFVVYFFFGLYVRHLGLRPVMHRVFFCVCLALMIWSFAFSVANSAPDKETALLWRRIAALGWGTIYSFLLHFFLILTDNQKVLRKPWLMSLIYLPAVVVVYVFGMNSELAAAQFNLIYADAGWVNVSVNSIWDWLFNLYYGSFTLMVLAAIWRWGRSSAEHPKKEQARMLLTAYGLTILAGTLTDIIINQYSPFKIPQIAPILTLIPVSVILYCIKKYGILVSAEKSRVADVGQILSEANRSKLYMYLIQAYVLGAFVNFASQYIINRFPFQDVALFSLVILGFGLVLGMIQSFRISTDLKDTVSSIIVAVSNAFLILSFTVYGGITVWAFPLIFIVVSLAFKQRQLLYMVGAVTITTLIYVWALVPVTTVTVDHSDHMFRIFIFAFILWIAFYINRIYIERLTENDEQVKSQKLLSQISADFVSANEINIDEKINWMLHLCGSHFQTDRTNIFLFSRDQKVMVYSYEWCDTGIKSAMNIVGDLSCAELPWWMGRILNREIVRIPDTADLPAEAAPEQKLMQAAGIRSMIAMPIYKQDRVIGFLSFDAVRNRKDWRHDHQEILIVLANLLADAMGKVEAEKEINNMAYFDSLTGLPNRTLVQNRMDQAIKLASRTGKCVAVFIIDVDSFKAVNDTMGHDGGDALLLQMAQRLSSHVRGYDTVARFGGDEFLIMFPQVSDLHDVRSMAEQIMQAFHQPLVIKNQEFFMTASVGIAVYPMDGEETDELIKNADLAMYNSKERGKNCYTMCSSDMKQEVLVNMELTNSLYRAQERNELVLHYQPQVHSATGQVVGVEALIRWQHPQKGLIPPGLFIPLAEKIGLINPIGRWVLETACHQAKAWQDKGLPPVRMAVNMSLGQFRNPRLVEILRGILQETKLDPAYLELEITESIAINEPESILRTLGELKALGVGISIDDFGTKYSSLSRLKSLPIDRIKIDMEFIHGISNSSKEEGIVKVILNLGRTLGLKVTAEGVENRQQWEFLKENLCDEIQGFLFYRPVPAHEIEHILRGMGVHAVKN